MNKLELILEYMKYNSDSSHFKQEIIEDFYPKSSFYERCDECSSENIYDNHRINRKTNKREFGYVCNDCGYDYYDDNEEITSSKRRRHCKKK